MKIRLNVAAVIIRDDKLLLVEFDDESGLHYNLPGGGVEPGETLHDALRREVREETCAELSEIDRLLLIWEYIGAQQQYKYGDSHKVALAFSCHLAEGSIPSQPTTPDLHQTGIRWVPLDELHTAPLIPNISAELVSLLRNPQLQPVRITANL